MLESTHATLLRIALERGLRRSTVLSYERLLRGIDVLDVSILEVGQEAVLSRIWGLHNHNSRRATIIAVRSVTGWKLKIPKAQPRRYDLPAEDSLRLALMLSPHEVRGLLMMYGGLRIGEACAVTRRDVDGDRLRVDKQVQELYRRGEARSVAVGPVKSVEGTITIPWWLSERLSQVDRTEVPSCVRESLRRAGVKAGIHLNPHMLRKWYITHLLSRGCPLELVRRQARHSHISITLTHYQEVSDSDLHKYM